MANFNLLVLENGRTKRRASEEQTIDFAAINLSSSAPTSDNQAATKAYVDSVAQGLAPKQSVKAATTGALTVTPSGSKGTKLLTAVANGLLTLDTVETWTDVENDEADTNPYSIGTRVSRVLVKNQANAVDNGIYHVVDKGSESSPFILKRSDDANGDPQGEVQGGMFVFVEQGTAYADTGWVMISNSPLTVDSDSMNFVQFSSAGVLVEGDGIDINSNSVTVQLDGTTLAKSGDGLKVNTSGITSNELAANSVGTTQIAEDVTLSSLYGSGTDHGVITTSETFGDVEIGGTEHLKVTATGGILAQSLSTEDAAQNLQILTGDGDASTASGDILIQSGASDFKTGNITIKTSNSDALGNDGPGEIEISTGDYTGSDANNGYANNLTLRAGSGGVTYGGGVDVITGNGDLGGGNVYMQLGNAGTDGYGGSLNVFAGAGYGNGNLGGIINLTAGPGLDGAASGTATLKGGDGGGNAYLLGGTSGGSAYVTAGTKESDDAGDVEIRSGRQMGVYDGSGGRGGNVTIIAGNAGNADSYAGNISLVAGVAEGPYSGTATAGQISLQSNNMIALDGNTVLSPSRYLGFGMFSQNDLITLQAPASFSQYSLILPAAQGGANTTLVNDGDGELSWADRNYFDGAGDSFAAFRPDLGAESENYPLHGGFEFGEYYDSQRYAIGVGGDGILKIAAKSTGKFFSYETGGRLTSDEIALKSYGDSFAPSLALDTTSGHEVGLYVPGGAGSDTLSIATARTERMRFDAAGNIGIGISAPGAKMDIAGFADTAQADNEFMRFSWETAPSTYHNYITSSFDSSAGGNSIAFWAYDPVAEEYVESLRATDNAVVTSKPLITTDGIGANLSAGDVPNGLVEIGGGDGDKWLVMSYRDDRSYAHHISNYFSGGFAYDNKLQFNVHTEQANTTVAPLVLRGDNAAVFDGKLLVKGGSYYTTFQGGSQDADLTYTLPVAQGAAGSVLTDTDGEGTLSWESAGSLLTAGTAIDITDNEVSVDYSIVLTNNSGDALLAGDVVIYTVSGGITAKASAAGSGLSIAAVGIVESGIADGEEGKVVVRSGAIVAVNGTAIAGRTYFVTATGDGSVTHSVDNSNFSVGNQIFKIGTAVSATEILFDPEYIMEY